MEIADNILKELLKNCYFLNGTASLLILHIL